MARRPRVVRVEGSRVVSIPEMRAARREAFNGEKKEGRDGVDGRNRERRTFLSDICHVLLRRRHGTTTAHVSFAHSSIMGPARGGA